MFSERYSSSFTSDAQSQEHGHICMSTTIDGLSYTPSQEEKTRDAELVVAASSESERNPMNSSSGFFTNSQNIVVTGGTFILNVLCEHGASRRKRSLKSKGEAERYGISSTSDAQSQQHGFIGMSTTVDELSYTPSQEEKTRGAEKVVATGRKSSKTLRGKGDIWPPLLQAALIEALEKYQQEAIRSRAHKSGRFSMRNQFISDYIYETTGKSRTPMQVGSRLQRLRDLCKGDKRSQLDFSSRASVTRHHDEAPSRMPTFINVQILLQKVWRPWPVPAVRFVDNDPMNPHIIHLSPLSHVDPKIRASTTSSSSLSHLSGTVKFSSPCTLELQSTFVVYLDNCSTPLHSEISPLKYLSSPTNQSGWLYSSEIAPDFWGTLCSSSDLTRYTILQSVKPIHAVHFESNAISDSRAGPTAFIAYKFSYQEPGLQTSFNTMAPGPSVYPTSYPSSHHPTISPSRSRWVPYHPRIRS